MSGPAVRVQIGIASARGTRVSNEDFAGCLPGPGEVRTDAAAALADGVGGALGGRVAAELAVRTFLDAHDTLDSLRGVRTSAATALAAINRWLHSQGRADASLRGMACTFTALVLRGRLAHVVHVGDSRLYRLRDDTLVQLTDDHVPSRGAVRNVLTRALGAEPEVR